MIPAIVRRDQLLAANGVFTLTLNAAFALGFALLGPLVVTVAGAPALILIVAALYLVAAVFCVMLPASPPPLKSAAEGSGVAAVGMRSARPRTSWPRGSSTSATTATSAGR